MENVSFVMSFVGGILTFLSPCILPMLPVYFVYLAGMTGDDVTGKPQKNRLIINSIAFVIGFTIVFTLLGATATSLGYFLKGHSSVFRIISGIIILIFGLYFIGVFKSLKIFSIEKRIQVNFKEFRFFSSVVFGMVFGFGWSPCSSAILGPVLLMAGNSSTMLKGVLLLLVYSLGLGVPFLLTAIIFEQVKNVIKQIQKYNYIISIVSGSILIIAGLLIIFDKMKYINAFLLTIF